MSSLVRTVVPWKAVLEPAEFVREQPRITTRSWSHAAAVTGRVAAAYLYNFVSYTLPIALAWTAANADIQVDDGLIISGGAFLALTLATFWWFHAGLLVVGRSRGLLHTFQSVASSTGVYLAGAFGFAYPSLIAGQGQIYETLRLVTYYGLLMDGEQLATGVQISPLETAAGIVAVLYFWYSFFLAARLRYGASRFESLVVTALAAAAPAVSLAGVATLVQSAQSAVGSPNANLLYAGIYGPVLVLVAADALRRWT